MAGTGKIKCPGRNKTSTAALQFNTGVSRSRGRKPWPEITWSSRLGVSAAGQPPTHRKKKFAKKPIRNTLDRCNPRRHKLRKRTIRLGTLNVQGIRNKTGEIIKDMEELKQDITIMIVSRTNKSRDTKWIKIHIRGSSSSSYSYRQFLVHYCCERTLISVLLILFWIKKQRKMQTNFFSAVIHYLGGTQTALCKENPVA